MAMDDLLHETSQLLARVTAHAAVVVGPAAASRSSCAACTSRCSSRGVLLAVVVMSNGAVEKETVLLDADAEPDDVGDRERAPRRAPRRSPPRRARRADDRTPPRPGDRADALAHGVVRSAAPRYVGLHHDEPLYVGGASRLAAEQEAFASTSASGLLELLEQHVVLGALMRELLGPGLTVRIGAENELADLRECSLVLAPYLVEGEPIGTVGVLGPTRMDYRKAQAAVSTVSHQLGQQLSR